jgi:hypothetical protein
VYQANNVHVFDFHDIVNALFGGGPAPVPAVVSFKVEWSGVGERASITNPGNGFAAEFVRGQAQMEWTATSGDFQYASSPLSTSSSGFAELGHERNGSFFP